MYVFNGFDEYKSGPKKGQPRTLTDKVIRYFMELHKAHEHPKISIKYRTFSIDEAPNKRYYIGACGSVRVGKSLSASIPITERVHVLMCEYEKVRYPHEIH